MRITFILNGKQVNKDIDPSKPLLRVLREDYSIKSVKEGCGRGECGTCTVILDGKPVTSCMVPAGRVGGREVLTLEGLEMTGSIRIIQKAFMESGAVQCGFCTPGMIITAYCLLESQKTPSRREIRAAISGNICRCTGYTKIIDAVYAVSRHIKENMA
ncbi:MAG: (2Fe-2S)-binding protein [Elusimicrobiota bacterium]